MDINQMHCCGFREIGDLEDYDSPRKALQGFCNFFSEGTYNYSTSSTTRSLRERCSHVVFTEVIGDGGYGRKFAAYIRKHKLGKVHGSALGINPNTHNRLRGYIWTVNFRALKAWWKRNPSN